ncbi:MAG: NAD(P)H-hydrate dehydratase [Clostridia bacterium]|nr:NAD(P)H-hydrate dehydratase [Clostridia bacterium]
MIRVLSQEDMQRWDASRIAAGIPAEELMLRAAKGLFSAVEELRCDSELVTVFCGPGNNGGDGYALACLLAEAQIPVQIISLAKPEQLTDAASFYCKRAALQGIRTETEWVPVAAELLVDAFFGIGLSRPITEQYADTIARMNASGKRILSADIPSGLAADTGAVLGIAVRATVTVTMQFYKPGLLLGQGRAYTGAVRVCSLAEAEPVDIAYPIYWQEESDVAALLPPRPFDSHKGRNGHALLCVGSKQYVGAALLSAGACLRSGCGILSVVTTDPVRPSFAALPEAITVPTGTTEWNAEACAFAVNALTSKSSVGVGCGIGSGDIAPLLEAALRSGLPLVLDADGLNCLSRNRDLFKLLHPNVVLTPHPGEMARLLDCSVAEVLADPIRAARAFPCTVLLKGPTTVVSCCERAVLCTEGTPGLAKGGSGDVLCGIITALLAQGLSPFDAARAGTYLLGTNARKAYERLGERMLLASDVIAVLQEQYGKDH